MKKLPCVIIALCIIYMNVHSENNSDIISSDGVQPGLLAMYRPYNNSITDDYLGWPLTCTPLVFTPNFSNRIVSIDTLKYNWESDTVCSCNSYFRSGGYFGRMWTSADAVSINEEECEFVIKRDSSRMAISKSDYLIFTWNISELDRWYIVPDSVLICDGFFSYYSRAIVRNGKIVDYKVLPNVVIDDALHDMRSNVKLPFQSVK